MLTVEQFYAICDFVRRYLEETAAGLDAERLRAAPRAATYRWQHTLNVLRNAEEILAGEACDGEQADIIRAAVILHDVSMFTCDHAIHGKVNAKIAEEYLFNEGYSKTFVARVSQAIDEHGIDFDLLTPQKMGEQFSWEGRVLIEADILDKLGASAMVGALLLLGKDDKLPHECQTALKEGTAMERAEYFKDYFWTQTGKRMAEQRFQFFLTFLEQMSHEVVEEQFPSYLNRKIIHPG